MHSHQVAHNHALASSTQQQIVPISGRPARSQTFTNTPKASLTELLHATSRYSIVVTPVLHAATPTYQQPILICDLPRIFANSESVRHTTPEQHPPIPLSDR
jgi:hypothetical protein